MKYYKEYLVTADPFIPEVLSSILWELDIDGINEEVGCLKLFCSEDTSVTVESISAQLEKLKNEKMIFSYNIEENLYEVKNWNEEWEKSINIIEIDDRLVIKPTFRDYQPKPDQIIIEIDPKMSFGTGDHSTTRLILLLMQKYMNEYDTVLDAGSGTGILSIAAVKTGARKVTAVDTDEWSYLNGIENAALNGTADKIEFYKSEIFDIKEDNFDIVFANIQKNVLMNIAGEINIKLKPEGIVILSGLLIPDKNDITEKYTSEGFTLLEIKELNEWIAMVFRKK